MTCLLLMRSFQNVFAYLKDVLLLSKWRQSETAQNLTSMLGCIPLCRAEDMLPLLEKCEEYADKKHHPDFVPLITYARENRVNRMGAENLSLCGS